MDFPRGARMTIPNDDSYIFFVPDLESPLGSGANELQMPELRSDPTSHLRAPLASSGGHNFTPNAQWEMSQSNLYKPIVDANISINSELPPNEGQSALLVPNKENLAVSQDRVDSELFNIDDQSMQGIDGTAGMENLPSGPDPIQTSFASRPNRPKGPNARANKGAISKKGNSMRIQNTKLLQFPPIMLVEHLENVIRSNDNVSEDFRHSALVCLTQLNDCIRYEKQHGSPAARKFLFGKDGFFNSSEISSPSLTQPTNTPISNSFRVYTDDVNDTSAMNSAVEGPSIQFTSNISKTTYYCTFPECLQQYKTRADWIRHEKTKQHWMQERYMCRQCVVTEITPQKVFCRSCSHPLSSKEEARSHCLNCHEAKQHGKTFPRKDKFRAHLQSMHDIPQISDEMESWIYSIDGDWPRQCGFCGDLFSTWEERANHIEEHFKAGKTMDDYKLPFPLPSDSIMQNFDSYPGKDNDDNDYEGGGGGGGGWDQTQSGMPPPWWYGSSWQMSSSASMGATQSQNRSNDTTTGTQYSCPPTVATPSTDLIRYKPQTPSLTISPIAEISPTSKNNIKSYSSPTGTKTLEMLLSITHTYLLLHNYNSSTYTSLPTPMKSLLTFPIKQAQHNGAFLHNLGPTYQKLASLFIGEDIGVVGAAVRRGRKHHQRRLQRQKPWERSWNGGALETELERVLVLGED